MPPEQVAEFWPQVTPLLEPALDLADDGATLDEVLESIESGQSMLWILDDLSMVAVMTEENGYLFAWLLGGTNMEAWLDLLFDAAIRYARQYQMKGLKAVVRPGLGRALRKRGCTTTAEIVRLYL